MRPALTWSSRASTNAGWISTSTPPRRAYSTGGRRIASRAAARSRWSSRRTLPNRPGRRDLKTSSPARASSRMPSRTWHGEVWRATTSASCSARSTRLASVVEEVLLHLVEDQVELAAARRRPLDEHIGKRLGRPSGGRAPAAQRSRRSDRRASPPRSPRIRRPSAAAPTGASARRRPTTPARSSEVFPTPLGPYRTVMREAIRFAATSCVSPRGRRRSARRARSRRRDEPLVRGRAQ